MGGLAAGFGATGAAGAPAGMVAATPRLPPATTTGALVIEQALLRRRSVRRFAPGALALGEVAQLLWAAQGVTDAQGHRTAPSAGALYPLEVCLVAGEVGGLDAGVYRYRPDDHALEHVADGDRRAAAASAAHGQHWIAEAPAVLAIVADVARTARKYGRRAERYVQIECGLAAQNVCLQCVGRGLATVFVGAFDDDRLRAVLGLRSERSMLGLMPVGHPA